MQEENNPYTADVFSDERVFCVYQSIKIPVQDYSPCKCANVTAVSAVPLEIMRCAFCPHQVDTPASQAASSWDNPNGRARREHDEAWLSSHGKWYSK